MRFSYCPAQSRGVQEIAAEHYTRPRSLTGSCYDVQRSSSVLCLRPARLPRVRGEGALQPDRVLYGAAPAIGTVRIAAAGGDGHGR
jgi:hypothetical protein